jgi:hypothetical protein
MRFLFLVSCLVCCALLVVSCVLCLAWCVSICVTICVSVVLFVSLCASFCGSLLVGWKNIRRSSQKFSNIKKTHTHTHTSLFREDVYDFILGDTLNRVGNLIGNQLRDNHMNWEASDTLQLRQLNSSCFSSCFSTCFYRNFNVFFLKLWRKKSWKFFEFPKKISEIKSVVSVLGS